jgi:putative peptidoglycan lipid II flippase
MNKKFTSTIAGASIFITLTGLISKGLGFLREIIFAGSFGLSTQFDVYLIGAVLPITLNTIILYLALNYLIPAYNNIEQKDHELADDFMQTNFLVFTGGGILLSLILLLFSDYIIGFYLHGASQELFNTAKYVFLIFLVSIPLNSAIAVLTAQHQIHMQFNYPAYGHLLINIVVIIIVLIFSSGLDIFVIPVAFVAGSVVQLVYLLKKADLKITLGHIKGLQGKIKKYIPSTLVMVILIEGLGQLYILADRYFYSYVPEGGIAALNYANTVFLLPISILSAALTTAVFPKFAQYIGDNQKTDLENLYRKSIRINMIIYIPVTVIFMLYGNIIIKIFFERGAFGEYDTWLTYGTLTYLSASIIFYSIYSIINKILYCGNLVNRLLIITIIGIVLKIIFNYILVDSFKQDGLALSTSLTYIFFFAASYYVLIREVRIDKKLVIFREFLFFGINGISAILIAKIICSIVSSSDFKEYIDMSLFLLIYIANLVVSEKIEIKTVKEYFIKVNDKI